MTLCDAQSPRFTVKYAAHTARLTQCYSTNSNATYRKLGLRNVAFAGNVFYDCPFVCDKVR